MDISKLPEPFRSRALELLDRPDIEKVKSLFRKYVEDAESLDEVMANFRDAASRDTLFLGQELDALETILDEPQAPGTLLRLAEWDANWNMDHDQTDSGAAVFLRGLADMLGTALEEAR